MGGKKKYINIFSSFTEPFNCNQPMGCLAAGKIIAGLALHWPCVIGVSSSPAVCSYANGT